MNKRVTSLLERVFMFLEDGEWQKADEYCEKVLDIDPRNAGAYLGKLMAEYKVRNINSLQNCNKDIRKSKNYKKALDFADNKLAEKLITASETIIINASSKKKKTSKYLKITAIAVVIAVLFSSVVTYISFTEERKKALDYTARNVGETLIFGKYDIDNDGKKEELEWVVLEKQDDRILVISKYAVEQRLYHNAAENVVWENCSLRNWLNSVFIDSAFSDEQKGEIIETLNINPNCYANDVFKSGGNDTKDSVFILSTTEAKKYLHILKENRMKFPFKFYLDSSYHTKYGWSWLRAPGSNNLSAAYFADGYWGNVFIGENGKGVCDYTVYVRPAMWLYVG